MEVTTRIVALVGPTASGKARLAFEAARAVGAEILVCDSMKVYRGMDVGTAKPDARARGALTWHGLDLIEPHERFDASAWARLADEVLASARERRVPVLIAGGTVLYLKALTEGLFAGVPRDPATRARIRDEAGALGSARLHERLAAVDPRAAARIHPNDLRRIERALEVHAITGKPITELQTQFGKIRPGIERVVLTLGYRREDMDERIDRRVDRMLANGWLEEVRGLALRPQGISREAEQALGYRELLEHVRAGEPAGALAPAVASIKAHTRRFARKQLYWLRHHVEGLRILEVPPGAEPAELHRGAVAAALESSIR